MHEAASDEELVGECLAGNRAAFDMLVRRHQRQVYRICYRFVGNHEDASDLAQDTFVRAFRALPGFKQQSAFLTWLHRIAVNVCLNHRASRVTRFEELTEVERATGKAEAADDQLLRRERARRVRAAIAQLPDKQRATLILRTYHELAHEEIATILGTSSGASKANLFHALRRLRQLLDKEA